MQHDGYTIERVKKLLKQGFKQKMVANLTDTSVTFVRRVKAGTLVRERKKGPRPVAPKGEQEQHIRRRRPRKPTYCREHRCLMQPVMNEDGGEVVVCVACNALAYREEHPEREWTDPLPILNEKGTSDDINDRWRWFNELDDLANRENAWC